jgi:hypothetical protein
LPTNGLSVPPIRNKNVTGNTIVMTDESEPPRKKIPLPRSRYIDDQGQPFDPIYGASLTGQGSSRPPTIGAIIKRPPRSWGDLGGMPDTNKLAV